jgi:hypothetical protein
MDFSPLDRLARLYGRVGQAMPEASGGPLLDPGARALLGAGQAAWRGMTVPGAALQSSEPVTSEQLIKPAMDIAGMTTLGAGAMPGETSLRMGIDPRETMARFFNKHVIPPPVPFEDRIWQNYASKMQPHELWDSEAIWGNARRMHEEAGWKEHEAFAYLMNQMLRRMGQNGYVSPEMASEHMANARLNQVVGNK